MKYIRTKDGIIDLERKGLYNLPIYNFETKENVLKAYHNQEERNCCCIDKNIFYDYCYEDGTIWEYEIVRQADTIEELCDEIIVIDTNDNSHYELHRCFGEFCLDSWLKQNEKEKDRYKFYGAIWTDKGLIYVAKMNDKGELELL